MLKIEDLTFPQYIYKHGKSLKIMGYLSDFQLNELKIGKGYIHNGYIWEYANKFVARDFPIIYWKNKSNEFVTKESVSGELLTVDDFLKSSLTVICNNTKGDEKFVDDTDITQAPSSSAVFIPEIGPKDDFLKKLIKTVFRLKQVPTTKYRKKLSKAYVFSNLFQGLNSETKISTNVWQTWIELIGIDCVIILKDSGTDPDTPINDFIVYKSRNDSINVINKNDIIESLKKTLDI